MSELKYGCTILNDECPTEWVEKCTGCDVFKGLNTRPTPESMIAEKCKWVVEKIEHLPEEYWDTSCNKHYVFGADDDSLDSSGYKYCPSCGCVIEVCKEKKNETL
jgi:hypothetical protein